ncbi:hypothetical protein G6F46_011161 [Rhizopus delemar]|uniref:Plasma membrane proteolipid 3 n=2 Tax=Rhizopus TaxID=4842 RepID=A0A9P7CJ40_9FUNG|nr:hypothetical protein G6F43_011631 [Rhizopus delemar]KAG1144537.1 hypothetical protein G6F38_006284 [Rhizopus arrhizus]KAG1158167.1 hypothetical protein G6F37_006035 [Rhizopus arrhizus]KAG1448720.1 hypothetical protein G6F55_010506 [Rhizopus delemar]KAG1501431.1 hypothetical protein G6F54_003042 [Rhizopus delemar]
MIGTCCLIFIIILLPPLGVFLMKGCGADFWINLCLTILGYLPGHLHAFYLLVKDREQNQLASGQGPAYGTKPPPPY